MGQGTLPIAGVDAAGRLPVQVNVHPPRDPEPPTTTYRAKRMKTGTHREARGRALYGGFALIFLELDAMGTTQTAIARWLRTALSPEP